ncbi:MAG: response regulator, partial [Cyclobacteriaceae bacterium]|nr:response regulator [Cyclobacteriaceae bacterium]
DLILLDLQMPEMDGYETAVKLRARNFKNPILALSAFVNDDVLKRCKESGIDQVISKPYNEKELIMTIIHKHGIDKKTFRVNHERKINIDMGKIKSTGDNNIEFKDKMIRIYINNLDEFLDVSGRASIEKSFDTIQYAAHKLIPSSRHMGFKDLVVLLKTAEEFDLNRHNAEEAGKLVYRIREIVKQVKNEVMAQFSSVT